MEQPQSVRLILYLFLKKTIKQTFEKPEIFLMINSNQDWVDEVTSDLLIVYIHINEFKS